MEERLYLARTSTEIAPSRSISGSIRKKMEIEISNSAAAITATSTQNLRNEFVNGVRGLFLGPFGLSDTLMLLTAAFFCCRHLMFSLSANGAFDSLWNEAPSFAVG